MGGHVAKDQECVDNAVIELKEELGLEVEKNQLHFLYFNKNNANHHFQAVFYIVLPDINQNIVFEKEEIDEIKWVKLEDLIQTLLVEKNQDWIHVEYQEKILNLLKNVDVN